MAEVAINLKGQDNLTETVRNAKKAVDDLKYSSTELGKCSKEFDRITNAGKPLKTQLRQLQQLMAEMNLKGLSGTDEFTRIAQKAGEIKDAMADASDAVKRFSSDTMKLDAAIQGMQGIAAATSIATGAMGLFGTESEKVQRAILKVQSALAILNGLQQIANLLNKDSALMQQIKAIRLAASTKATQQNTAAMAANTVTEKLNTSALAANTAAQRAWNTAKAIGKALFGDITGLILVGVAGLSAYALATDNAEYSQKMMNDTVDKGTDKQKEYSKVMGDTYSSLMTSYTRLRSEWNTLRTDHEKNQWIVDNRNKLDDLELSITNVESAERIFNGNTNAVVDGFIRRAKAAARLAELTELYRQQMELIDKRSTTVEGITQNSMRNRTGVTARAGQPIPSGSGNWSSKYGNANAQGRWVFSEQGARNWNQGLGDDAQSVRRIDEQIQKNNEQIGKITSLIEDDVKQHGIFTKAVRENTKTDPSKTTTEAPKFAQGSLDDLETQLDSAKRRLTSGLFQTGETQDSIKKLIEDLQAQVKEKKIELGLELSDEAKILLQKQKEDVRKFEDANKRFVNLTDNRKYAEVSDPYDVDAVLEQVFTQMDYNEELIKQLETLKDTYEELGNVEGIDIVTEKLKELKQEQEDLNAALPGLISNKIDWEMLQAKMQSVEETAKSMGYAFSSLGRAFSATGEESMAAVMEMVSVTMQGVSQVIPQIMALIAAKQGEALASGNASAAKLPYPANIAAMASVTATIIATFAGIIAAAQRFAGGGIVSGGSAHGDQLIARVNSGEMILNGSQQKRLFDLLDGNGATGSNGVAQVEWKIKGADLYGSLRNYSNIKAKVGKKIL